MYEEFVDYVLCSDKLYSMWKISSIPKQSDGGKSISIGQGKKVKTRSARQRNLHRVLHHSGQSHIYTLYTMFPKTKRVPLIFCNGLSAPFQDNPELQSIIDTTNIGDLSNDETLLYHTCNLSGRNANVSRTLRTLLQLGPIRSFSSTGGWWSNTQATYWSDSPAFAYAWRTIKQ